MSPAEQPLKLSRPGPTSDNFNDSLLRTLKGLDDGQLRAKLAITRMEAERLDGGSGQYANSASHEYWRGVDALANLLKLRSFNNRAHVRPLYQLTTEELGQALEENAHLAAMDLAKGVAVSKDIETVRYILDLIDERARSKEIGDDPHPHYIKLLMKMLIESEPSRAKSAAAASR
jgi:hypothetical protein